MTGHFLLKRDAFSSVIFAGGGNRCWWQAGLITRWTEQGFMLPSKLLGTSAGAAIAAAYIVNRIPEALESCLKLYRHNETLLHWGKWPHFEVKFAHRHIYPSWIESIITNQALDTLKASSYRLTTAVTHSSALLGSSISICLATVAYLLDKKVWHNIHPQLPRYLGLRQGFYALHECATLQDSHALLCAAAAAPPVMAPVKIQGLKAFDGG